MAERTIKFVHPVSTEAGMFQGFPVDHAGVFGVLKNGERQAVGARTLARSIAGASLAGPGGIDALFRNWDVLVANPLP